MMITLVYVIKYQNEPAEAGYSLPSDGEVIMK